ncbi:uncharacterized protein LOC122042197 isoform X1 [Zingiber officinale]|uniref:uncharacterized protein LOC122042197 isoform X1 n=1 Tax=Zingiber officinale TaxID=94328 RepID=UPI001C4C1C63|nr:uncharacterized protein LOC122042197 isoform X1 [Zingiber officinale]XP_042458127.1 uncharacterized protein LOC122042197 isoform X1 [Zingiber officinale]XP_042458128.1 uncharacterized protein LOC122042197 isoform X1 [Zingiber officinale]XP_042458129.1 uncharacterized protein LOC122042197 isoform X1 [Zingiber officinale]XP_042458130.1 uncharacterized protein LOC122042197 isoform X1 [Zingiber officinale]XP_042458131.1 uncharacterized protein LOC122042197 isoform X1 [Zingiber officinale]
MAMKSQQLLDSLTAHIAVYHAAFSKASKPNPSPRTTVLRWFSALSGADRQAALTFVDPDFVRLLLLMVARLRSQGHGFFFVLPDLPSDSPSLPSLCFRRSHGLLSRAAAIDTAERDVAASLLLFASSEDAAFLDTVTVSEDLVVDVDRFVAVMDAISGGRFLRGEVTDLAAKWLELPWLKDKGYYSIESFVANRFEVALRLSWVSSEGGKKLKGGKAAKGKTLAAGLAANALWRRKGCVDWWAGLDPGGRKKIIEAFLGKAAKYLVNEITLESKLAMKNEFQLCKLDGEFQLRYGPIPSWVRSQRSLVSRRLDFCIDIIPVMSSASTQILTKYLNCILMVQEISSLYVYHFSEYEEKLIFFSTLSSAGTIWDKMSKKLHGLLMVIYTNYTNVELLGDANLKSIPNKNRENSKIRRLKGKKKAHNSRKLDSTQKVSSVHPGSCEPSLANGCKDDFSNECETRLSSQEEIPLQTSSQKANLTNILLKDAEIQLGNIGGSCKSSNSKKKNKRKKAKSIVASSTNDELPQLESKGTDFSSLAAEIETKESATCLLDEFSNPAVVNPLLNGLDVSFGSFPVYNSRESSKESVLVAEEEKAVCTKIACDLHSTTQKCVLEEGHCPDLGKPVKNYLYQGDPSVNTVEMILHISSGSCLTSNVNCDEINAGSVNSSEKCLENGHVAASENYYLPMSEQHMEGKSKNICGTTSQFVVPFKQEKSSNDDSSVIKNDNKPCCLYNQINHVEIKSYEWPIVTPQNFSPLSLHVPAATERLHLDGGHEWPAYHRQSFLYLRDQPKMSSSEGRQGQVLPSLTLPMSFDWPPMVKSYSRLGQAATLSYDSGYNSKLQSSFCTGFPSNPVESTGSFSKNDRINSADIDMCDKKNISDLAEDTESYWQSEEEMETHMLSARDYNKFFGGGLMYWNPAEHVGSGFSCAASHSSEDSAWAWHEADLNRAIDDMVGTPGISSYNTNGLASPTAIPFCSPFDAVGPGHQSVGYTVAGNEMVGKIPNSPSLLDTPEENSKSINNSPSVIEGMKGDTLPIMLRPIIVPSMSRRGSRLEFKVGYERKSPCRPCTRRDAPRIKRPPSPVVLCVPRVPQPPPPSPVVESRKRGFPSVRSGSSSPRHWGVRNWYSDESTSEEIQQCFDGVEVVWPSWGNKGVANNQMVPSFHGPLLTDHLITIPQLAFDQEHSDLALPLQPPDSTNFSSIRTSLSAMRTLHEEIDCFCKQVAAENLIKKPHVNWAVKKVTRSLQVLWPRSRTNIFGSNATGLALPTSDVDLVVSLPPVRNLEPIKEAGILEGRNGIKETCLQHAARYLANQEWVRNDSLKTIENTAIPVIKLVAEVPTDSDISRESSSIVHIPDTHSTQIHQRESEIPDPDLSSSDCSSCHIDSKRTRNDSVDAKSIHLDISFKSSSHTGLQTSELVRELTQQFPAAVPLALVLKKFLADRSLDRSYSGGLSSYCLILLLIRFLQHEHHAGRPNNQNLGGLLMDFLYFFGYIFDPRQMRVLIQGSGIYLNRERGLSIDPLHIDDPLYPTNNVGRNCFRIHQCIKAFADAYSLLENELQYFSGNGCSESTGKFRLLQKIIPSIDCKE